MASISRSSSYLIRNPYSYCFRLIVPKDLQPIIGRKELRRSLKTGYLRTAKSKARLFAGRVQGLFQLIRESNHMDELPRHRIQAMIEQLFRGQLHISEFMMEHFPPPSTQDSLKNRRSDHEKSLQNAKESLTLGDYSLVKDDILKTFDEDSEVHLKPDTPQFNAVCRMFLKNKIRYHEIELERLEGDFSTDPECVFHTDFEIEKAEEQQAEQDRIDEEQHLHEIERVESLSALRNELTNIKDMFSNVTPRHIEEEKLSVLLSELWKQYKAENEKAGRWGPATLKNYEPKVRALLQVAGNIPINKISTAKMREYREILDHLPPNYSKIGFKDLSGIKLRDLTDST